jgi:hypothetical protein
MLQWLFTFATSFESRCRTNLSESLASAQKMPAPFGAIAKDVWLSAALTDRDAALVAIQTNGLVNKEDLVRTLVKKLAPHFPETNIVELVSRAGVPMPVSEVRQIIADGVSEFEMESSIEKFRASQPFSCGTCKSELDELSRWNASNAIVVTSTLFATNGSVLPVSDIMGVWFSTQPERAAVALNQMDRPRWTQIMPLLADILATNNPDAISLLAKSVAPSELDPALVAKFADVWLRLEPASAMQWLKAMTNVSERTMVAAFRLTLSRPTVAETYLNTPGETLTPAGFESLLASAPLVHKTPAEALEWAATLSDPVCRRAAIVAALMRGASQDPATMPQQILKMMPEAAGEQEKFVSLLGRQWIKQDFEAASNWLLANGSSYPKAVAESLISAVKDSGITLSQSSDAAINWLGRQTPEFLATPESRNLAVSVASEFYHKTGDAEQTSQILEKLPPGPARDNAFLSLAHEATLMDPYSAANWLARIDSGPLRDKAVQGLVNAIPNDPVTAFRWAVTIADADIRERLLRSTMSEIGKVDATLAAELLSDPSLSQQDFEKLRKNL